VSFDKASLLQEFNRFGRALLEPLIKISGASKMGLFGKLVLRKALIIGLSCWGLSGCAMPLPLQVASWALDGLSYVATDKSMTDHGLSMVAQKDCALLRGLTEGSICKNWDDAATLVADTQHEKVRPSSEMRMTKVREADLASVVKNMASRGMNLKTLLPMEKDFEKLNSVAEWERGSLNSLRVSQHSGDQQPKTSLSRTVKNLSAPRKPKALIASDLVAPVTTQIKLPPLKNYSINASHLATDISDNPILGIYYVIGSFRNFKNAKLFAVRHGNIAPNVLVAEANETTVYRVVVGPVSKEDTKHTFKRMVRAGLPDSWAIRVQTGDWRLAHQVIDEGPNNLASIELARAVR